MPGRQPDHQQDPTCPESEAESEAGLLPEAAACFSADDEEDEDSPGTDGNLSCAWSR